MVDYICCVGCPHFDPKKFYCFRFSRGVERIKYCNIAEMKEVLEKEMAYAEYQND